MLVLSNLSSLCLECQLYRRIGASRVLRRVEALPNLAVCLGEVSVSDAHSLLGLHAETVSAPGVQSWRCRLLQFSRRMVCFFRNCVLGENLHGSTVALSARSVVCWTIWLDSVRGYTGELKLGAARLPVTDF